MQLFNIGPVELILILVIMFILLGPEGMVKTARQIGSWIRALIRSPMWRDIMGYSREIRELPTKIVRETGLDEDLKEIQKTTTQVNTEINSTIRTAGSEVEQTLRETGNVDVRIDTSLPAKPKTPPAAQPPAKSQPAQPVVEQKAAAAAPVVPAVDTVQPVNTPDVPVQTYHKYTPGGVEDDEEED